MTVQVVSERLFKCVRNAHIAQGSAQVEFSVNADETPANEVACNLRVHELEQYRFADTSEALWAFVGHTVTGGVWAEHEALDDCTWPAIIQTVPAAEITAGLESLRFVARSLDHNVSPLSNAPAWFRVRSWHGSDPLCIPE